MLASTEFSPPTVIFFIFAKKKNLAFRAMVKSTSSEEKCASPVPIGKGETKRFSIQEKEKFPKTWGFNSVQFWGVVSGWAATATKTPNPKRTVLRKFLARL